jgi:hypothetical protein
LKFCFEKHSSAIRLSVVAASVVLFVNSMLLKTFGTAAAIVVLTEAYNSKKNVV